MLPGTSTPGTNGTAPRPSPIRLRTSVKLTPANRTLIVTSPGPGSGSGTSATLSTSGPPYSATTPARIGTPFTPRRKLTETAQPAQHHEPIPAAWPRADRGGAVSQTVVVAGW